MMRCDTVVSSGVLRMVFASVLREGEKARIRLIKKKLRQNFGRLVGGKRGRVRRIQRRNGIDSRQRLRTFEQNTAVQIHEVGGENNFVGNRIQVFGVGSKGEYPDVQRLFMRIYGVEFHRPVDIEFVGVQKQLRRIRNDAGATVEDADDFPIDMPFAVEFVRGRKKVIKRPDKTVDFNRGFRF